jgi:hypothetical protein
MRLREKISEEFMTDRKAIADYLGSMIAVIALSPRTLTLLFVLAFGALGTPSVCVAQVQLPAVNLGETNFEDGFAGRG